MNFQSDLKKGIFIVGQCTKCKKIIWPPSEICNNCFGDVVFRPSAKQGKIIEFSSKEGNIFCVAEFEKGVRIMGRLKTPPNPHIGQKIQLEKFQIIDDDYLFEFSLLED